MENNNNTDNDSAEVAVVVDSDIEDHVYDLNLFPNVNRARRTSSSSSADSYREMAMSDHVVEYSDNDENDHVDVGNNNGYISDASMDVNDETVEFMSVNFRTTGTIPTPVPPSLGEFIDLFHETWRRQRQPIMEDNNTGVNNIPPENAVHFDTELPTEHAYLGELERVSGVQFLEEGQIHRLPIYAHYSIVFPGQTIPMIITNDMFQAVQFNDDGLLFGLVFERATHNVDVLYGVTCQVYERSSVNADRKTLKTKSYQRFMLSKKHNPNFSELQEQIGVRAYVEILPEIILSDPIYGHSFNSLSKYKLNDSMNLKLRKFEAGSTYWPKFVYDQYDVKETMKHIKQFLASLSLHGTPDDPVAFSYWCAQNILLNSYHRMNVFLCNSVVQRLLIIEKLLIQSKCFTCKRCKNRIAHFSSLFSMSKGDIQSTYCNSAGYIHETRTFTSLIKDSIYLSGAVSSEFSWFPEYSWQIMLCYKCNRHVGWKYIAQKKNLYPPYFYGLSSSNISMVNERGQVFREQSDEENDTPRLSDLIPEIEHQINFELDWPSGYESQ